MALPPTLHRASLAPLVRVAVVLGALGGVWAATPRLRAAEEGGVRAAWIARASLESVDEVRRAMTSAASSGAGAVLIPLTPGAAAGIDATADAFREATARNLRAFAWLDVSLASVADEVPGARDSLIHDHPEWLMVPRQIAVEMLRVDTRSPEYVGRLARWTRLNAPRAEGLYVSPILPDAAAFIATRTAEALRRFNVDGVHLDGLLYPGDDFDYSRRALDAFRSHVRAALDAAERARMDAVEALDPFAYPEEYPAEWREFRQHRLTSLVTSLRTAIRTVRPSAIVSVGVTPDADHARRDHLQDWRGWMDAGLVDAVARRDRASGQIFFSYETLIEPLSPVVRTSQRTGAGAPQ